MEPKTDFALKFLMARFYTKYFPTRNRENQFGLATSNILNIFPECLPATVVCSSVLLEKFLFFRNALGYLLDFNCLQTFFQWFWRIVCIRPKALHVFVLSWHRQQGLNIKFVYDLYKLAILLWDRKTQEKQAILTQMF